MRRAHLALAAVALALLASLPIPAAAQMSSVQLTLRSAPIWNAPDRATVIVELAATNAGATTYGDLEIAATLRSAIGSRSAYDATFLDGSDAGRVLWSIREPRGGTLTDGGTLDLTVSLDLATAGVDATDSGIYPLRIELFSGDGSIGVRTRCTIGTRSTPIEPLRVAWSVVLDAPIRFLPKGAFLGDDLAAELKPTGRLGAQIAALGAFANLPGNAVVDLIISPLLLEQLDRMRRGYAVQMSDDPYDVRAVAPGEGGALLADRALESLALLAGSRHVRLGSMPYAEPSLPSLVASDLPGDVNVQLEVGLDETERILGVRPDPSVVRPPGSAIDAATLALLARRGVGTVILDAGTVDLPAQPLGFAPPAEVSLDAGGGERVAGLAPDPGLATLLADVAATADPVLAAHVVLGELAAIWLESPGTERTLAIALTEAVTAALPPGFFAPFADGIGTAPWLRTRGAATIAADLVAISATYEVAPQIGGAFTDDYVQALRESRHRVEVLGTMLVEDAGEVERLRRLLLLAQSAVFLDDPARGQGFIAQVDGDTTSLLGSIRPLGGQQVTLTSSQSVLPIQVENIAPQSIRATVRIVSQHLRASVEQDLTLGPGEQRVLSFDVALRSSGRFPLQVQIVSPIGAVVSQTALFVRSTELNRQALAIVIGASAILVVLWFRRLARARRSG
ncbi:MAG: DUF6049 family protein [Actinomycetota bacterium]